MSARDDRRVSDLLPGYVLGALEDEERARVDAALESASPELERELGEHVRVLESLAATVSPVEPSETTRARLLRRLGATKRPARGAATTFTRWSWVVAAGLVVLAGSSLWTQSGLRRELDRAVAERGRFVAEIEGLRSELRRTEGELERLRVVQQVVGAPGARSTVLAAQGELAPSGPAGRAFHDPGSRRAVFYAAGLSAPGQGRTYQLWYIADGVPVSAGIFEPDAAGAATLLVEDVAPPETIDAWAVTLEPAGGVPQPTGPMLLAG